MSDRPGPGGLWSGCRAGRIMKTLGQAVRRGLMAVELAAPQPSGLTNTRDCRYLTVTRIVTANCETAQPINEPLDRW